MPLHCTAALLTLATHNLETLSQFYAQLLHLEAAVLIPNVYTEFHLPNLTLGIFRLQATSHSSSGETYKPPLSTPHAISGMSLCLEVENLEAAIAHLAQLGYPPPGEIMFASHGSEIYACDPDGNWLILHEGIGKDG